jgi:DNA polymerase elongation subunit (family B)
MRYLTLDVETVAIDDVDTYLEPVSAPSNYKDEQKIAEYCAEKRVEQAAKAALDIDLARIVALGYISTEPGQPSLQETHVVKSEAMEARVLGILWDTFFRGSNSSDWFVTVTFNGLNFDLPLLLRRSLYLGVKAPRLQLDRYRHPHVIDLMQILSHDGRLKYHGLQFYLNRFGIGTEPDITGAEIAAAVKAGDWAAVEKHCTADVKGTHELAKRIGAMW